MITPQQILNIQSRKISKICDEYEAKIDKFLELWYNESRESIAFNIPDYFTNWNDTIEKEILNRYCRCWYVIAEDYQSDQIGEPTNRRLIFRTRPS